MSNDTPGVETTPVPDIDTIEYLFYSNYRWSLNPFLKLDELINRLDAELKMHERSQAGWQQEESRINLYIFSSAISCTLDDYLLRRPFYIRPLANHFPEFRGISGKAERFLNFIPSLIGDMRYRKLFRWKSEWEERLDLVCRLLVESRTLTRDEVSAMRESLNSYRNLVLPGGARVARMKINEGFRCQDMSYHDVFALGDKFLDAMPNKKQKIVIVGSRTAGSYLGPLLKAYLGTKGIRDVSWIAVRPKFGIHEFERKWLAQKLTNGTSVILIDDFSNTGGTFRMLEEIVKGFGIPAKNIVILAPIHPHKPVGQIPSDNRVMVLTLNQDDLFMKKLFEPANVESIMREHFERYGARAVSVFEDPGTREINRKLWSHYADSYQVRLKRVYDMEVIREDGTIEAKRIIGKAVGLGWLGYHSFFAGLALEEFVPKLITLRRGILFTEWVDGTPLTREDLTEKALDEMAAYLAARNQRLSLDEDPKGDPRYLGWGWLEILALLRRVYGNFMGYPKNGVLLKRLKRSLYSPHALVDGKMMPDEWLKTETGMVKTDFEHHNFGAPELDVVDPAYDLAISSFEFSLDVHDEENLVNKYSRESGDVRTLSERVFLYKLLYGAAESDRMFHRILHRRESDDAEYFHRRFLHGWNFRVYAMAEFAAGLLTEKCSRSLSTDSTIFFMDLDGVFDAEFLGFPHTTKNGLKALSLLRSDDISVIPNTGRSVEHIKNYCNAYGFVAGIGEYGSVIYDNERKTEIPLIDDDVNAALNACREVIGNSDGVFIDPDYKYALRVFKYAKHGISGLTSEEAESVIKRAGVKSLKAIVHGADTYLVGIRNDKGNAVASYKEYLKKFTGQTIAMGDSDEDIPMLEKVNIAFSPGNCSTRIRDLARQEKVKVVQGNIQSGLLSAVQLLTRANRSEGKVQLLREFPPDSLESLIVDLLTLADFPRYKRAASLLFFNRLGPGVN